ncbi:MULTISPECIES: DUF1254 domain-containing protein [Rhodococcus]|uniref:DUF1254 domain-containing protein n=1 Tax=Rhodococcus TaxID=1827 RepID=UPI00193C0182|nr:MULTISPECIES: DUF1254 domain-containing protein [Rhodococcus]QRI77692.1 DUF1254 domain-containing protein [Rhodococcus aetherivorans]QSE61109.1 DUF1254 domain-containing protein [Rhodococcus sp. PSBB066]QSE67584.1 DUF1254 domain-containing protein [Rhodococcus sp. PSBB049]
MSTYKMVTDIPPSITTPNSVETRLGTLRFFDGLPDEATVQTVYDNLDFQRAVQAFLTALPAASLSATRAGIRTFGPDNQTMLITESLMDSHTLLLTANTETIYTIGWLDTKAGPLVIEVPPRALGMIDDFWQRYVGDVGNAGPDRGQGGKYLLLPPDYSGDVPAGYFVLRSRTYGNLLGVRAFIVGGGDVRAAADSVKSQLRIYPLAEAADPPATSFVNISGALFNTIHANDVTFFDEVVPVVQEEPLEATDPEVRGLLAAIGIRKGTPFAPDDRMRSILAEGAAVGNATARALVFSARNQDAYHYPDSAWQLVWIGNDYQFSPGGVLDLDARALFYYMGLGISPAMAVKMVGIGSQYGMAYHDGAGQYLNGGKNYRLRLPGPIPAKDFWSIVVYDPQTRTMLQTDQQFPSLSSQKPDIAVNPDAAVDIYFGPEAPAGQEANWIQTIPGKGWFVALRLYGPLEPWFDKAWRPGEIELVS